MSVALATESCVLSSTPGRVRIHAVNWTGASPHRLEAALLTAPGVRSAVATAATHNVLITYDPAQTGLAAILHALNAFDMSAARADAAPEQDNAKGESPALPHHNAPRTITHTSGGLVRARIVVKGMDRDPDVARRMVERLRQRPGVRRVVATPVSVSTSPQVARTNFMARTAWPLVRSRM